MGIFFKRNIINLGGKSHGYDNQTLEVSSGERLEKPLDQESISY